MPGFFGLKPTGRADSVPSIPSGSGIGWRQVLILEEAWRQALRDLQQELPPYLYDSFIRTAQPLEFPGASDDRTFVLGVGDESILPQLRANYRAAIQGSLENHLGRKLDLQFQALAPAATDLERAPAPSWLNPRFTFERFHRDPSNQIAALACESVALQPGRSNPFFLQGEPGSGKTHLIQAMAALMLERNPALRIHYTGFEDLRDEFLNALRQDRNLEFKDRYRQFDVLIIEDVQYIRSAGQTVQEEFFHIFHRYYEGGRQLVLTSERPASELLTPSRLLSRLLSGLQVRLGMPETETRRSILRSRAEENGIVLSQDMLEFLSARVHGGVRELESAVHKLYFLHQRGLEIDQPSRVREHLADLAPEGQPLQFSLDLIVEVVCRRYGVTREEILSSSRKAEYTLPRHVSMYLSIQYSNLNKSAVARYFRKSDHTTVINAERNIQKRIANERGFSQVLDEIVNDLRKECV